MGHTPLAEASVRQVENGQTPFLALVEVEGATSSIKVWAIQNQGSGPAVNVRVRGKTLRPTESARDLSTRDFFEGRPAQDYEMGELILSLDMNPIGPGNHITLMFSSGEKVRDCDMEYSALDGRNFVTTVRTINGSFVVAFRKT